MANDVYVSLTINGDHKRLEEIREFMKTKNPKTKDDYREFDYFNLIKDPMKWDVKWNAYNEDVYLDDEELHYEFCAPWELPKKELRKFMKLFSDVQIEFYVTEQANFFCACGDNHSGKNRIWRCDDILSKKNKRKFFIEFFKDNNLKKSEYNIEALIETDEISWDIEDYDFMNKFKNIQLSTWQEEDELLDIIENYKV